MITVQARSASIGVCLLLLLVGCSREQQDWRAAEGADTVESYGEFIQHHPDSELTSQARARVAQLGEDRDWQHAGSADTVNAYRDFLQQHPVGKWSQEARIRIENFSLSEQTGTDAGTRTAGGQSGGTSGRVNSGARAAADAGGKGAAAEVGGEADTADPGAMGSGAVAHGTDEVEGGGPPVAAPSRVAPAGSQASGLARPGDAAVPASADHPDSHAGRPAGAGTTTTASPQAADSGATPPMAATGSRPGTFGIQLGAFSSEASANAQWHTLVGRFGPDLKGLQEHLVTADTPTGRVYRLQAQVGAEVRARAICDSLKGQGQGCVAVLPH